MTAFHRRWSWLPVAAAMVFGCAEGTGVNPRMPAPQRISDAEASPREDAGTTECHPSCAVGCGGTGCYPEAGPPIFPSDGGWFAPEASVRDASGAPDPMAGCPIGCGSPTDGTFDRPGTSTLVMPSACREIEIRAWGAGGGHGEGNSFGAAGGLAEGTVEVAGGDHLTIIVGGPGLAGRAGAPGGGGEGGYGPSGVGGGGGGFSGVFLGASASHATALVVAGGGGGSGAESGSERAGAGGGVAGDPGSDRDSAGTTSTGGESSGGARGSALRGGDGQAASTSGGGGGGGGGGYYGGAGADGGGTGPGDSGGGGSGFVVSGALDVWLETGVGAAPPDRANRGGAGEPQAPGRVVVRCR